MKNPTENPGAVLVYQSLIEVLRAILVMAFILLPLVFAFYYYKFSHFVLSGDQAIWGQFGDYIGGTLNPIFSFLTVILLIATVTLQNRQLRLSRMELSLTRRELTKSSEAQHKSQEALNMQAQIASKASKLNTISFLLEKYNNDIKAIAINTAPEYSVRRADLTRKKLDLERMVENIFNDVIAIDS